MSSESFSTNPSNGVIILKGTQNYLEWIYTIKMVSNGSSTSDIKNVWKYIDPKGGVNPEIPILSARPTTRDVNPAATSISKLSPIELEDFKFRNNMWKEEKMEIQEIERRLEMVQNKVLGSISESLLPQLKSTSTIKEILKHLSNKFRPSDQARKQELFQKWNTLKLPPKDRMIIPWLDEWESVFEEAKELKMSIAESPQAQYDFLFTSRQINEAWATSNLVGIGIDLEYGRLVSDFPGYLKEFRQHQRLNEIFSRNPQNSSNSFASSGVFAVTKDDEDQKKMPEPSTTHKGRKQNGEKVCLCGLNHLYEKCFYINYRNTKPPPNFHYRKETFDNISNKLKPNSMEKLRNTLKSKYGYDPIKTPSEALNLEYVGFTRQQIYNEPTMNQMGSFTTLFDSNTFKRASLLTSDLMSDHKFHLHDHWVLDSGSDVHICNNELLHQFEKTETPSKDHHIVSGTAKYPVVAWGTCKVSISTKEKGSYITLNKVALIPGFMTNLISLRLLNAKGVHWNTLTPLHMFQSDGSFFCTLFQSGRHWTFEKYPIKGIQAKKFSEKEQGVVCFGGANRNIRHKTFDKVQLHRIFGHPSPEVVDHISDAARKGSITVLNTKPAPKTIQCETCALSKSHQLISRVSDKEHPHMKPFERLTLDLIPMREGFNSNTQIIHFQVSRIYKKSREFN
ncbi:hypothetical protein GcC1_102017 [Golovinomyces cichoracearum]|uniref:Retrovirus-related Pol polyprotein from transposon TNT 1-94-like beta-barrel domain-containing protein n=1 Tax=Golovinomyces cichoracearum TaxID=62708 RepID=A0A420IA33_9PEZI|nr:hypothetical protein GcC1_102017 [Golovinomyces cichoracearum]